ncbi:MAG: response regulator [Candidatus Omnitrophica bacterium]|nr:response regulator [Candidatus Omnitrophota bacterium]
MSEENGKPQVLIVDDDAGICSSLGAILRDKGYAVTPAVSRAAAIAAVSRQSWQIAIVDLRLPDGSGAETIQEIKRLAPETICILMTAYAPTEDELAGLKRDGAVSFLKPLPLEQLLTVLQRAPNPVRTDQPRV